MAQKKTVSAKQVLADIRSGMSDDQLIQKYGISAQGLQSLFAKLLKAGYMTQAELDQRSTAFAQTVDLAPEPPKRMPASAESTRDVLREFAERFNIPREDLERLKRASIKDIKAFFDKHDIPLSEGKELVKALGLKTGDLLSGAAAKPKSSAQDRMEETGRGEGKEPWYENSLVVILLVICFFPVGLYGLWRSSKFSPKTKKVLTGVVGVLLIAVLVGAPKGKTPTRSHPKTVAERSTRADSSPRLPVSRQAIADPEDSDSAEVIEESTGGRRIATGEVVDTAEARRYQDMEQISITEIVQGLALSYVGKRVEIEPWPILDMQRDSNGYFLVLFYKHRVIPSVIVYFDPTRSPNVKRLDCVVIRATYKGRMLDKDVFVKGTVSKWEGECGR